LLEISRDGKGRRALGAALLLASATIAAPALSAAQEGGGAAADPGGPAAEPVQPSPPVATPTDAAADPGEGAGGNPAEAGDDAGSGDGSGALAQAPAPASEAAEPASKQAKAAASATVSVGDNFYSPVTVTVNVGDTVSWRNAGAAQHSATADNGSFDTGVFGPGASRSNTFSAAGSFGYFCTVHGPSQSGTVRVLAASGGGGGGGGGSSASEAAAVSSPDAAGSGTSLPATGFAALAMALIGITVLASGAAIDRAVGKAERGRPRRPIP
jgi:plastocyanin